MLVELNSEQVDWIITQIRYAKEAEFMGGSLDNVLENWNVDDFGMDEDEMGSLRGLLDALMSA